MAECKGSSTKQLKQCLGFWDLMGASVGQIIGAGIMTLLGAAIAMTGRSVPVAFLIAAVITVCQYAPLVFISGTVRLRGGQYTMITMLAGKKYAGAYSLIFTFSNLSLSMYALSFALVVLTIFFILNCLGIDKFAKVQNLIVGCLVIALAAFAAFGVGEVKPGYMAADSWMTGGMMGLLQAGGLLTFAVGGANCIVNLSAEAKKPTRDIPMVMIISTLCVAVIYGIVAVVAAGVLPVEQVAGENLSIIAKEILSGPIYVFFMFCGAGFALISTLNSQFAWAPKPIMQACDDGWLPHNLAKLSKWNTPIVLLGILYVIGVVCILTGLSVSILGNMCLVANGVITFMINCSVFKLPSVVSEAWDKSRFRCSKSVLMLITVLGSAASAFNIYLNASRLSKSLLMINVVVIVVAFIFGTVREKKANVEVSYEEA